MTTLSLTEIARAVGREWGVSFEDMLENHGAALVPSRMPPAEGGTAV